MEGGLERQTATSRNLIFSIFLRCKIFSLTKFIFYYYYIILDKLLPLVWSIIFMRLLHVGAHEISARKFAMKLF